MKKLFVYGSIEKLCFYWTNGLIKTLITIASIAIAAFYGAGLMWGRQTHLSIAEYWRWWFFQQGQAG